MIRYFIGPSGTGKTWTLYEELKALCQQKMGRKGILIVPEQFTLQAEQALASEGGFGGLTITSFRRLIQQVLEETGLPQGTYIDGVGKSVAVRSAFIDVQDNLTLFNKVQHRSGFISLFTDWLSELRQAGIGPELLRVPREGLSLTTQAKLSETALVFEAFNQQMAQGFYDEEMLYALMAEAVLKSERLAGSHIWVDGFYFFNGLEHEILKSMGKVASRLTIALTFDPERVQSEPFAAPVDTFETLHKGFTEMGLEIKKRHFTENKSDQAPAIRHLAAEIFEYPGKTFTGDTAPIGIWQMENPLSEVMWVAGQIRDLKMAGKATYKDVAVLHQQAEVYHPLIKRIFAQLELPYFLDDSRQLTHSPLVTYLRAVLQAISGNYQTDAMMRALKTGLFPMDKAEVDQLETYVQAKGVKFGKWLKPFKDEAVEPLRLQWITCLSALKQALEAASTASDMVAILWTHLESETLGIKQRFETLIQSLFESGELASAHELAQGWQGVIEVLEQMTAVAMDKPMTLKTFSELFATGVSLKEMKGLPTADDSITVSPMDRFRSAPVPYVFMLGFNDGVIPSLKTSSGILSDEEKQQLQALSLPLKSDSEWLGHNELFLIYQALTRPLKALQLSYSLGSSDGKPLRPSMYIDRIQQFMAIEAKHLTQDQLLKLLSDSHLSLLIGATAEGLRRMASGYPMDDYWLKRFEYLASQDKQPTVAKRMVESVFYNNQPTRLSKPTVKSLYGSDIRASITRLEAFNACPFSHFVRYGLRPEKEKQFEVSLPDMGNLFHTAVERFALEALLKNPEQAKALKPETIDLMMEQIVDQTLVNQAYDMLKADARSAYLVNKLKRTGKRAARLMMQHLEKGVFEPKAFELAFGMGAESIPPIVIELANGHTIYLEGRIDRVDIYDSGQRRYVKIIDYKSGNKKYQLADVYNGLQIQLAVYMDAVLQSTDAFQEGHPLCPAGMFYFKIDDPMVEGEMLSPEEIEKAIRQKLKMDGLVVGDRYVAAFMDEALSEEGSKSEIIPFELKKEGEPSRFASYLSEGHFEALLSHVRKEIHQVCLEMTAGKVALSPYRCGNETACDRCDYQSICQFDLGFKGNQYRNIHRLDREALIEKLEAKGGETDGEVDERTVAGN